MKKDINPPLVEDVAVAIVKEQNEEGEEVWNSYLINLKEEDLEGVLVTTVGYGDMNEEKVRTSTLRHFLDEMPSKSFKKIEPMMENVFGLNNEFWVSFYLNKVMYDKKYIFLPETIKEENFTTVPVLEKRGVLIK